MFIRMTKFLSIYRFRQLVSFALLSPLFVQLRTYSSGIKYCIYVVKTERSNTTATKY